MVEGICHGYLQLIILNAPEIDLSYVSTFILQRIDQFSRGTSRIFGGTCPT